MENNIAVAYAYYLKGEKPLPLVKEKVDQLKEGGDVDHPLTRAKRYELVSIPEGVSHQEFVKLYLEQEQSKEDTIYVAILDMGSTVKHEEVTEPSGRCKTTNTLHKGARKWNTLHVVYTEVDTGTFDENDGPITEKTELSSFVTKGEAVDFARKHVLEEGVSVWIQLERRLDGSDAHIASLEPEMKTYLKKTEIPHNEFLVFGKGLTTLADLQPYDQDVANEESVEEETVGVSAY